MSLIACDHKVKPIISGDSLVCEGFAKIKVTPNDKNIIRILDDIATNSSSIVYEQTYSSSILMGADLKFSDEFLYSMGEHNDKYRKLCPWK